jgi:hypothetical protein
MIPGTRQILQEKQGYGAESGAPLIRARFKLGLCDGPGSAANPHSASKPRVNALVVVRCARDTS